MRSSDRPDSPLRVLIVADRTGPRGGGVGVVVKNLCVEFPAVGVTPAVFSATAEPDESESAAGVPVFRTRLGRPGLRPREIAGFARQLPAARRAFRAAVREFGPDVINVHFLNSGGAWLVARRSNRGGTPVVASAHGRDVGEMADSLSGGRIARRVLRASAVATACSEALIADVRRRAGNRPPVFRVVHNGVSIDAFANARSLPRPAAAPYLLGVGELHPKKGFDLLLEAFREVGRERPDLYLLVPGEGVERERLRRQAKDLGVGDRLVLPGHVRAADLPAYYAHAEAFALSSRREPFGIVALEAMAAGVPVVAARVGGVPEFVRDRANGLLVPPEDAAALAGALRTVLADRALAAGLVEEGRRTAERLTWRRTAEGYRDACLEALR
ncbi:MAG: glycosyltransferase family 4 protein [Planctomycetota bacterium]